MIFTRIPERYNTSVTRYDERLRQKEISEKFNEIAVWHFVGKRKPWKKDIINTIIIYILKRRLNGVQSILLFKKYEKK